jgi:hypothetical protein
MFKIEIKIFIKKLFNFIDLETFIDFILFRFFCIISYIEYYFIKISQCNFYGIFDIYY